MKSRILGVRMKKDNRKIMKKKNLQYVGRGNLKVSVNKVISVKVVVILTKGIEQRFCNLVLII